MKFWKKHETPYCEIKSVKTGNHVGDPVAITLTKRGAIEFRRRERRDEKEQAKLRRRRGGGVPIAWVLGFDDPCHFGNIIKRRKKL